MDQSEREAKVAGFFRREVVLGAERQAEASGPKSFKNCLSQIASEARSDKSTMDVMEMLGVANPAASITKTDESFKTVDIRKIARIHSKILSDLKRAKPLVFVLVAAADALGELCQELYTTERIHEQLIEVYGHVFEQPPVLRLERQMKEKQIKQLKSSINSGSLSASGADAAKETLLNLQKEVVKLKEQEKKAEAAPIEKESDLF